MFLKISKSLLVFLAAMTIMSGAVAITQAGYGGHNDRGSDNRTFRKLNLDSLKRMSKQALLKLTNHTNGELLVVGQFSWLDTNSLISALAVRRTATLNLLERMSRIDDEAKRAKLLKGLIKSLDRQVAAAEAAYKEAGEKLILRNPKKFAPKFGLRALLWFPEQAKDEFEKNYVRLFLKYRDLSWFRGFLDAWLRDPSMSPE